MIGSRTAMTPPPRMLNSSHRLPLPAGGGVCNGAGVRRRGRGAWPRPGGSSRTMTAEPADARDGDRAAGRDVASAVAANSCVWPSAWMRTVPNRLAGIADAHVGRLANEVTDRERLPALAPFQDAEQAAGDGRARDARDDPDDRRLTAVDVEHLGGEQPARSEHPDEPEQDRRDRGAADIEAEARPGCRRGCRRTTTMISRRTPPTSAQTANTQSSTGMVIIRGPSSLGGTQPPSRRRPVDSGVGVHASIGLGGVRQGGRRSRSARGGGQGALGLVGCAEQEIDSHDSIRRSAVGDGAEPDGRGAGARRGRAAERRPPSVNGISRGSPEPVLARLLRDVAGPLDHLEPRAGRPRPGPRARRCDARIASAWDDASLASLTWRANRTTIHAAIRAPTGAPRDGG